MRRLLPVFIIALAGSLAVAVSAPAVEPNPYENRESQFRNIAPPGAAGVADTSEVLAHQANKNQRPPHFSDQLAMYGDLVYATPGLKAADISKYFKDASFGVKPGDVERQYDPCPPDPPGPTLPLPIPGLEECPDLVIQRDKGFGVPHIYGATRTGAMFGAGYVAAEDRLFFIDVLRNYGRSNLSEFAGGANREVDQEQWAFSPYTEADLQRQIDQFDDLFGEQGRQLQQDLINYSAGVNRYITETKTDPSKLPGEYGLINQPQGPEAWKPTDVVAIAALVGGIFGKGGGQELDSALVFESALKRFGGKRGRRVFADFRSAEDPEAPTTVHKKKFPYQVPPRKVAAGSRALPDPGSVKRSETVPGGSASSSSSSESALNLDQLLALPSGNSNALTVSARESKSGHPLAVFGPQTGYFAPQILMEQDIHAPLTAEGPAISARGVSFPGTNLYVQLGRGDNYSWSATSASQDIVDTFAVDLCNPGGGAPTLESTGYMFRGECTPIEVVENQNTWEPSPADQTPPGSETLRAERTKLGIVTARATVGGRPVIYTLLRSTYGHEVDSGPGFADFNDPNAINGAKSYQRAAHKIGYTFNWLYVDNKDVAYFNSGNNPVRAEGVDTNFPVAAKFEWKDFDPNKGYGAFTPFAEHPQVINQSYITSWNNKQAPGYRAADSQYAYGSTYRSEPLDDRIKRGTRGKRKMSLVQLIDAMEDAGTVDHRGDKVLPFALRVLGKPKDPKLRAAVDTLRRWTRTGAHRRDRDKSGTYDDAEAVRIMDAWWPLLLRAQFEPALGKSLYNRIKGMIDIDDEPNVHGDHLGSAYNGGWYGYAEKDLRAALGNRVKGRYSRIYCGGAVKRKGNLSRCRRALTRSLVKALAVDPATMYADDSVCSKEGASLDPQFCFDAVRHRPLGGITQPLFHWINRPTFQQVVEIR